MNSSTPIQCDESALLQLVSDELPTDQRQLIEEHLETCESCLSKTAELASANWSWDIVAECLSLDEFDTSADFGGENLLYRELAGWLDPTDDPHMLGRFAGYEIVGVIGHGGMGIVLKGFESALNRYVAIKILAPRLASNASARRRFSREAQAAAAVRHDNVVAVHCVGEWHELPFLVMPYIGGQSLQDRIDKEGPLSIEATLRIATQVAEGLAAAHSQGLVHRDIKPANILLENGVERVTITDFGLARAVDEASITRTGVIAGTPEYMSPEQTQALPIDRRSDIFSLGSVMYAMLTGRSPFKARENIEVMRRIREEQPHSIRDLQPSVPVWLVEIVRWMHEKAPTDRPYSTQELAERLGQWLGHTQQPDTVEEPAKVPTRATGPTLNKRISLFTWCGAAFGGILAILMGIVILLEMQKGTLRIESDVDDVPIQITQDDQLVKSLTVDQSGESVRISAGQYRIHVGSKFDNIRVDRSLVTLGKRKREVVRVLSTSDRSQVDDSTTENTEGVITEANDATKKLAKAIKGKWRLISTTVSGRRPKANGFSFDYAIFGDRAIIFEKEGMQSDQQGQLLFYELEHDGVLALREFPSHERQDAIFAKASIGQLLIDGGSKPALYLAMNDEHGATPPQSVAAGTEDAEWGVQYHVLVREPMTSADHEEASRADRIHVDNGTVSIAKLGEEIVRITSTKNANQNEKPSLSKRLQGNWRLVRQVTNDGDSKAVPKNAILEIKGDHFFYVDSNERKSAMYTVDETKSPAHIDLTIDSTNEHGRGLVSVDSDRLVLCLTDLDAPETPRPNTLEPRGGYWYMEYQRAGSKGESQDEAKPHNTPQLKALESSGEGQTHRDMPAGLDTAITAIMGQLRNADETKEDGSRPWHDEIMHIRSCEGHQTIWLDKLYADDRAAFGITSKVVELDGRNVIAGIAFRHNRDGEWELIHLDVEPIDNAVRDLTLFQRNHPAAQRVALPGGAKLPVMEIFSSSGLEDDAVESNFSARLAALKFLIQAGEADLFIIRAEYDRIKRLAEEGLISEIQAATTKRKFERASHKLESDLDAALKLIDAYRQRLEKQADELAAENLSLLTDLSSVSWKRIRELRNLENEFAARKLALSNGEVLAGNWALPKASEDQSMLIPFIAGSWKVASPSLPLIDPSLGREKSGFQVTVDRKLGDSHRKISDNYYESYASKLNSLGYQPVISGFMRYRHGAEGAFIISAKDGSHYLHSGIVSGVDSRIFVGRSGPEGETLTLAIEWTADDTDSPLARTETFATILYEREDEVGTTNAESTSSSQKSLPMSHSALNDDASVVAIEDEPGVPSPRPVEVKLSKILSESGFEITLSVQRYSLPNLVCIYLLTPKSLGFQTDTLRLKAILKNGKEIDRAATNLKLNPDDGKFLTFSFRNGIDLAAVAYFELEVPGDRMKQISKLNSTPSRPTNEISLPSNPRRQGSIKKIYEGFVYVSIGRDDGVDRGSTLTVLRNDKQIGQLRITGVGNNESVCRVFTPDLKVDSLKVGDVVTRGTSPPKTEP